MGNDWTRITQEASALGGPDGLRRHYFSAGRSAGRVEGAVGLAVATLVSAGAAKAIRAHRRRLRERETARSAGDLTVAEVTAGTDSPSEEGGGVTGKPQVSEVEQNDIVAELIEGFDTFEPQEFEDLYDQLDSDHRMEVDQSLREWVDGAVGDEHWDSDS